MRGGVDVGQGVGGRRRGRGWGRGPSLDAPRQSVLRGLSGLRYGDVAVVAGATAAATVDVAGVAGRAGARRAGAAVARLRCRRRAVVLGRVPMGHRQLLVLYRQTLHLRAADRPETKEPCDE